MGFRLTTRRGVGHRDVINHTQVNTPKSVFESSNGHEAESVWIFQRERERDKQTDREGGERDNKQYSLLSYKPFLQDAPSL